jgi:surfactin synthase thioesterase subunit
MALATRPAPANRAQLVDPPRSTLVCFPYAGGSASFFSRWASELAPSVRVVPMQYPGRGHRTREALCTSMESLVRAQLCEVEGDVGSRLPFAFWGHSLGARVAFEVAVARALAGYAAPAHLFVSACAPPHRPVTRRRAHLPDDEFVAALAELDPQTAVDLKDPTVRALALPPLRADLAVFEKHVPSSPATLSCNVTVFGGRDDSAVSLQSLRGWEVWTRGRVRYLEFDGGHFFVKAHRASIAAHIRAALAFVA